MKKIVLALLTIFSTQVEGQNLENSLLWKISGNGLKEASYLYGTIHITCDDKLPPKAVKAMNQTKQLYLELDMDDPTLQQSMMGGMMMKEGKTLTSLSSAEDFKLVDDFLQKNLGYSAQMLNTIKPFMISAMLYPKMIDCEMKSVEGALIALSKEQNEEILGLETVQEQLAVFDAIPYEVQMNELVKTAKSNLDHDKTEMDLMLKTYKSEDITAMVAMMKESENEITSKFEEVLLTDRNKKWIPQIETIAKETPTFFGVGAGHLGGENGVIVLLRKAGYKVEAVF
ncbi:TraB/GumN family protein [Flavobacterium lacus]|uniref:TraB family protein n=1 Tax=Flavobacterium lacus TaxID=1353778 RepID=A0A328WJV9_9FLAO|nr:TraB/GumN family protein [Flavobacterium lacus]RAR46511.1 hypothetical protein B0I10_1175 [Flavobacterium lacus]